MMIKRDLYFSTSDIILINEEIIIKILTCLGSTSRPEKTICLKNLVDKGLCEYLSNVLNSNQNIMVLNQIESYPVSEEDIYRIMERQLNILCVHNFRCFEKCIYDKENNSFHIRSRRQFWNIIKNRMCDLNLELNEAGGVKSFKLIYGRKRKYGRFQKGKKRRACSC